MYGQQQYPNNHDIENPMLNMQGGYQNQYSNYPQQQQEQQHQKKKKEKKHKHHERKNSSSSSSSSSSDDESLSYFQQNDGHGVSSDKFLRSGFVTKVYSILTVQMIVTFLFCALSMVSDSYFFFQQQNIGLLIAMFIVQIICVVILICSRDQARKVPNNYILLGLYTITQGYIIGFICGFSNPRIVLMATFVTLGIFFALTLYACTTKTDFTLMGGALAIASMSLFIFGILMMFTNNNTMHIIYATFSALLFGFYILYDTQLIIGTKSFKYTIDDYIIASLELYMDIIGLFIEILSILQRSSND